jgi:glycolate oxidase iron-sulfur subunit
LLSPQLSSTLAHEEEKLLACIHCGLCLEACPTYVVTGDENDGPRGRLYLMRAVGESRLGSDSQAFERHIDRCLGCRACEQVCPAGVEYGQLLEAARGELFESGPQRGLSYGMLRLVLKHVWLHPARLKFFFAMTRVFRASHVPGLFRKSGLAKLISKRLEFALALLESSAGKTFRETSAAAEHDKPHAPNLLPAHDTVQPQSLTPAMLFTGCVGAGLFSRVNEATTRVLQANGFKVQVPSEQVCCGALHAHAGDLEGARKLARNNLAAFHDDDTPVITNAGGCGAMLASYTHLLEGDEAFAERARNFSARVRDVSQQLASGNIRHGKSEIEDAVTYDSSCHLLYGQHAGEAPLKMMEVISDLKLVRLEGSERCCGGAGIYNLLEPDLSRTVLEEKLAEIRKTGAKYLATGNPGCQMQIGAGATLSGMDLVVCHPIELLDEAYSRAGMYRKQ